MPSDRPSTAAAEPRPALALVVPCYNEAARLDVEAFVAWLGGRADIYAVFVDDGSTDGTRAVLADLVARCPERATVLALPRNGGKAEAVRQGMRHALAGGIAPLVGFWDADLATPLDAVDDFLATFRRHPGCRWVLGSRVRLLGRDIVRNGARHYAGRAFATCASLVLGLPVYDTQCGAKLFVADDDLRACLAEPFLSRWIFDVELIARYRVVTGAPDAELNVRIHELPLVRWRDVKGSKVTGGAFVKAALELWRIHRTHHRAMRRGVGRPAGVPLVGAAPPR